MQLKASLAACFLLAGCGGEQGAYRPELPPAPQAAPEPPRLEPGANYDVPGADIAGPRGSSQPGPGEHRYDEVGYAGVRSVAGGGARDEAVVAIHPTLPANSYVEVTSLDTGRTVLVLVTGNGRSDNAIDLSPGAARQLGYEGQGTIPVRVRAVMASPQDQVALRSGRPAEPRADAPPVLLNGLRKRLPAASASVVQPLLQPSTPAPAAPPRVARPVPPAAIGRYFVQVAALSSAGRAQSLAQSMGGFVKAGGGLYRVQLGPFASNGEAQAARGRAARAGYGDARIFMAR